MPKSRKRKGARKKRTGPQIGPGLPSMDEIRRLARRMDSPELREIYRRQQIINPNLDADCDELAEEIKEIFNHGNKSSKK